MKVADNIDLILGDCMDLMHNTPDNYYSLSIVDPPYGVNLSGGRGNNGWSGKEFWDKARNGWNEKIPNEDYFSELIRISKNQIIWGGNYFPLPPTQCWLIWDKGQRDFSLADGEMAWTSFDKAMRIKTIHGAVANQETKIHPTQKPIKLYEWILMNYAQAGDKILDTHLGSGSSAIAAHRQGFSFTGIEIDKDYYEAAVKRFRQYAAQLSLFQ